MRGTPPVVAGLGPTVGPEAHNGTMRKDLRVATDQDKARAVIADFLKSADKGAAGWNDDTGLWGEGLELDSLEAAELSALLEDEFGSDPFSEGGDLPETVGDVLAFYVTVSTE
jgi:acyl carrier protein